MRTYGQSWLVVSSTTTLPLSSASDHTLPLLSVALKAGAGLPTSLAAKADAGARARAALPSSSERRWTMIFDMLASYRLACSSETIAASVRTCGRILGRSAPGAQ